MRSGRKTTAATTAGSSIGRFRPTATAIARDYALTKRKELAALGLPLSALRIAVVVTSSNVRHAVLTVVTDKGDYVLDNLSGEVLPWERTGFTWIERQNSANAMAWVSLRPADRLLASAGTSLVTGDTH
ncbi:MAG: transglutaminase-like cysteine peptidase [Rhizomicrobium sp.]